MEIERQVDGLKQGRRACEAADSMIKRQLGKEWVRKWDGRRTDKC